MMKSFATENFPMGIFSSQKVFLRQNFINAKISKINSARIIF